MDLLHKRYASPFSLIDNLISTMQFDDFVTFLINKVNKEKNDREYWEFYLAKVHDKSFSDWKKSLEVQNGTGDVMDDAEKEKIVSKSTAILNGFVPT